MNSLTEDPQDQIYVPPINGLKTKDQMYVAPRLWLHEQSWYPRKYVSYLIVRAKVINLACITDAAAGVPVLHNTLCFVCAKADGYITIRQQA